VAVTPVEYQRWWEIFIEKIGLPLVLAYPGDKQSCAELIVVSKRQLTVVSWLLSSGI
jgi:hypothetical protein